MGYTSTRTAAAAAGSCSTRIWPLLSFYVILLVVRVGLLVLCEVWALLTGGTNWVNWVNWSGRWMDYIQQCASVEKNPGREQRNYTSVTARDADKLVVRTRQVVEDTFFFFPSTVPSTSTLYTSTWSETVKIEIIRVRITYRLQRRNTKILVREHTFTLLCTK